MNIFEIDDSALIEFCKECYGANLTHKNTQVKREKKQITVYLPKLELGFEQQLEKVFVFKKFECLYKYGCIRLDFSKQWQQFVQQKFSTNLTI